MKGIRKARDLGYLVIGILLLAALWGGVRWNVVVERENHLRARLEKFEILADDIASHSEQIFHYADTYLKFVRKAYTESGLPAVTKILRDVPLNTEILSHITIIDRNGTPLLVSGHVIKSGTTAKDREYFKLQMQAEGDLAQISLPRRGRNSGKVLIRLVRRVTTPDGAFAGVVFAAVHVPTISRYLDAADVGAHGEKFLLGEDGKVRAAPSPDITAVGVNLSGLALFGAASRQGAGSFDDISPIDGKPRSYNYKRLENFPLGVVLGLSPADIDEAVSDYEETSYSVAVALSAAIVLLIFVILREMRHGDVLQQAERRLREEVREQTTSLVAEIEERRAVERALQESEARMGDFAEASSDWFWGMDENLRFSYFSGRFEEVTGVPPAALFGKTREETGVPNVDPEQWERQLADLAAHRSFRNFEHPRAMPNGEIVHLSINGKAIFDADGQFRGYRGSGSEITQQKEAEQLIQQTNQELERRVRERTIDLERANEQLFEEDANLREILENSPVGIVIVTHNYDGTRMTGDRLFVNDALVEMFGWTSRESFLVADISESWADKEKLEIIEDIFKRRDNLRDFEVQRRRMDGSPWWVSMSSRPIRFANQDCTIIWHFDITERVESEQALRRSQTLEAVGQLTGGVAHDFNNLLAVILGNAELLGDTVDETASGLLNAITRSAQRGSELTQRLLAFSRRQPLQPVATDPTELIDHMKDLLRRTLTETIELEIRASDDLMRAIIDPGQLENALLNLAVNAQHAMPGGGKLRIDASNVTSGDDVAVVEAGLDGAEFVKIAVSDSGTGIAPDVLEHVFEPFYTTKDVGQGSGLGLSMVYGFAKQSGGHVTIDSTLGEGTTVSLYLPGSREPKVAPEVPEDHIVACGNHRILVVEDDSDVRAVTTATLQNLGYRVEAAATGAEALEVLRADGGFDLLFTDVVMPGGISGLDLTREARRRYPDLNVLLMSGYAESTIEDQGLPAGAELLAKPFSKQDLNAKLHAVLDT